MFKSRGGRWQRTAAQVRNERAKRRQLADAVRRKQARERGIRFDESGSDSDALKDRRAALTTSVHCPHCKAIGQAEFVELAAGTARCGGCGAELDESAAVGDDMAEGVQELDDSEAELDEDGDGSELDEDGSDEFADLTVGRAPQNSIKGAGIPHAPKVHIPSGSHTPRSSSPRPSMRPPKHIVSSEPHVRCPGCERRFRLTERNSLPIRCVRCGQPWSTADVTFSRQAARRLIDDTRRATRPKHGEEFVRRFRDGDPSY